MNSTSTLTPVTPVYFTGNGSARLPINSTIPFTLSPITVNNGSSYQETNDLLPFGIWPAPFFVFSILVFVLFLIFTLFGYFLDKRELKQCDVIFVEPLKKEDVFIYSVSLKIRKVYYNERDTESDIIMRIRGSLRDSPMILFRDSYVTGVIRAGKMVNIGFAVPFELGTLQEINIAGDSSQCDADEKLFSFSDVSIRKLERVTWDGNHLGSIRSNLQTWHANETIKYWTKGSFFNATSGKKQGQTKVVCARSTFITLQVEEEQLKWMRRGFFSQHYYLPSFISRWYETWSDYSQQDVFMVMGLDLLTGMTFIVSIYAFGLNWRILGELTTSTDISVGRNVVDELIKFVTTTHIIEKDQFLFKRVSTMLHLFMVAIVSASLLIPISFAWKKLFSVIGGKGFYARSQRSEDTYENGEVAVIPRPLHYSDINNNDVAKISSHRGFVLRTLECRNRRSTVNTYALKSRHFRLESVVTNCQPDVVTARVIAFIRTKLDKLDDADVDTGAANVRNANTIHETRTLTSDVPEIDAPELVDNGINDIVGVVRFCERIIQQVAVPYYVMDNSLIAECFIVKDRHLNQRPHSLHHLPTQNGEDDFSKSSQSIHYYEMPNQENVPIGIPSDFYTTDVSPHPSSGRKRAHRYKYDNIEEEESKDESASSRCSFLLKLRFKKIRKTQIYIIIAMVLQLISQCIVYLPFCTGCNQFTVAEQPIKLEQATIISFIFLLFIYLIFCVNLIAIISLFLQLLSKLTTKNGNSRQEQYKI